jgi:leucyl aminopeptidase
VWHLPILPEHSAELKGTQSDSRSTGKGRYGGASTAAAFLKQFVEKEVDWAHVDIAGPSNYSAARGYFPSGATGFGVQLLYTYLKKHHHQQDK